MKQRCSRPTIHAGVIACDLDLDSDEPVWVENTSDVNVVVYVAQGSDEEDWYALLEPGQSAVVQRVETVAPNYHVLDAVTVAPGETVRVVAGPYQR